MLCISVVVSKSLDDKLELVNAGLLPETTRSTLVDRIWLEKRSNGIGSVALGKYNAFRVSGCITHQNMEACQRC